jgi:hypothetical protein
VLREVGETETAQENIQDWLQPDEGDPRFQLLAGRFCCSDIFLFIFIGITYIIKIFIFFQGYLLLH